MYGPNEKLVWEQHINRTPYQKVTEVLPVRRYSDDAAKARRMSHSAASPKREPPHKNNNNAQEVLIFMKITL
jgi:hypothetical protein